MGSNLILKLKNETDRQLKCAYNLWPGNNIFLSGDCAPRVTWGCPTNKIRRCTWKFPDCCYNSPVKADEKGGQGHTSASPMHQFATLHRAMNMHNFTGVLFDFVFRLVCDRWPNRAAYLFQVLREARYIRYRNPWNTSRGCWRTFLWPDSNLEWPSRSKAARVSGEDNERSNRLKHQQNAEHVEKFEKLSTRTVAEQSRTPLGSVIEFSGRS